MKKVFAVASLFLLCSCSGGGGGGSSETTDPVYGTWVYTVPGSTSTQAKGIIATIDKESIQINIVSAVTDGSSAVYYFQKAVGTYTRSGSVFHITYNYQTCSDAKEDSVNFVVKEGKLYATFDGGGFMLSRATSSSSLSSLMTVEDKSCNKISKVSKAENRSVASAKGLFQSIDIPHNAR